MVPTDPIGQLLQSGSWIGSVHAARLSQAGHAETASAQQTRLSGHNWIVALLLDFQQAKSWSNPAASFPLSQACV